RPIEKVPVDASGKVSIQNDLPRQFKQEYRDYLEMELPKLAETIKAHWVAGSSDPAAAGGGLAGGFGGERAGPGFAPAGAGPIDPSTGQPMLADDSVVIWNPANQQEILAMHFGFTMKNTLPSTLEVLYAQEDYWVFDNIM